MIHDRSLVSGANADRARLSLQRWQGTAGDLVRSLGHSISLDYWRVESAFELGHQLARQGRRAGANESQRTGFYNLTICCRLTQNRLMHGRNCGVPGWSGFFHPLEESSCVETRSANHAGTRSQRRKQRAYQAMDMKERHDIQAPIGWS